MRRFFFLSRVYGVFIVCLVLASALVISGRAVGHGAGSEAGVVVLSMKLVKPVPGRDMTTAYIFVLNDSHEDDRLVTADMSMAERLEIHTIVRDGDVMKMRQLDDGLVIHAGEIIEMQPGGDHLMIFGLKEKVKAGDKLKAVLTFERAGNITVPVDVVLLTDLLDQ